MKSIKAFELLLYCFLLTITGCELPTNLPENQPFTLSTKDYLNTYPGFTLQYSVTAPANINFNGDIPTKLWITYQNNPSKKIAFISSDVSASDGNHFACCYFTINSLETSYNGGAIWGLSSLPFQKLHLPATLEFFDSSVTVNESTAWYGIGTYTITYGVSTGGFNDCIKIDFSSAKLNYSNQLGHGSYWLAKNVGIVRYEATLDENGVLGNAGESFLIIYEGSQVAVEREISGKILDKNDGTTPIPNKHVVFGTMVNLYNIITDENGIFTIPIFFIADQNIPPIKICDLDAQNQPINEKNVPIPTCSTTNIDLGSIMFP